VIGAGLHIKGSLTGDDAVELRGTLEGDSTTTAHYHVREGARVIGDVSASSIVIEGEVSGRVLVAERVEIGGMARVRAYVRARLVAIAEGAFFDGQVHMQGRDGPAAPVAFREKRKDRRRREVRSSTRPPDPGEPNQG
jgi:cytoskeletal protein CcmA (bactofilin family)